MLFQRIRITLMQRKELVRVSLIQLGWCICPLVLPHTLLRFVHFWCWHDIGNESNVNSSIMYIQEGLKGIILFLKACISFPQESKSPRTCGEWSRLAVWVWALTATATQERLLDFICRQNRVYFRLLVLLVMLGGCLQVGKQIRMVSLSISGCTGTHHARYLGTTASVRLNQKKWQREVEEIKPGWMLKSKITPGWNNSSKRDGRGEAGDTLLHICSIVWIP